MTPEELGTHVKYIREGIDELKQDKQRQWERLDEHSTDIASLKTSCAHAEEEIKDIAKGSGKKAGLLSGAGVSAFINILAKLGEKLF